jgi:hypothetical protein
MPQLTAPPRRRPHADAAAARLRDLSVHTRSPSLLDLRFTGDPWIVVPAAGSLVLCLGGYPLAHITGSALDVPSLNQLLAHARSRRPRGRDRRR